MKRLRALIFGFGVLIVGLLLIPLPGPGWIVILSGLAILAKEFGWAQRLLERLRARRQGASVK